MQEASVRVKFAGPNLQGIGPWKGGYFFFFIL